MPKNRFDRRARLFSRATGTPLRAARDYVATLSSQDPLIGPGGRQQMLLEGLLAPRLLKGIYAPDLMPALRLPALSARGEPTGALVVSLSPEGREYWKAAMECSPAAYSVPGLRARHADGEVELFLAGTSASVRFEDVQFSDVRDLHKVMHRSHPRRESDHPGRRVWCIFEAGIPPEVTEFERDEAVPEWDSVALTASTLLRKIGLIGVSRLVAVDCWQVIHGQWNVVEVWIQHLRDCDVERLVQRLTSSEFAPQWTLVSDPRRGAPDASLRFSVVLEGESRQVEVRLVSVADERIPGVGQLRSWPSPGTFPAAHSAQVQARHLGGSQ